MRFVLALILVLPIASVAGADERQGELDQSSRYFHEAGFPTDDERGATRKFIDQIMPREIQKTPDRPTDESTATGNR